MIHTIIQEYNKMPKKYQKAIYWGLKIIGAELSKTLILLLFFLCVGKGAEFLFTMAVLMPVRCNKGGLHCKTYWGCLLATALLFMGAIIAIPQVLPVVQPTTIILLVICMVINMVTEPVINPTRPALTKEDMKKIRWRIGVIFTAYIIAACIFYNHYIVCGMWIIVEQTVQLLIATIKKKGGRENATDYITGAI